ncbi:unnamed protein product, partial [Brassica oleracea var. botrytis]|uniref:BZIP domain-containing protein n=2 Tax=Brassica oleracea TaxID=3712 RepID=A0A0D3BRQ9_BRAOL
CYTSAPTTQQQQLYGVFPGADDPSFPVGVGDPSGYGKRAGRGGYQQAPTVQQGVCYGGGGGFRAGGQQMVMVGPLSPVSSDGLGHGQVDNIGDQYGFDMGGLRGRKRVVEKVVERRQRRMIKNRESAARSRARKQHKELMFWGFMKAYTVELEAELNQLKEENAQLKHALVFINL